MKVLGEKQEYVQELLDEPEYLMIEPTNRCNLNCITCTRTGLKDIGDISYEKLEIILNKFPSVKTIKFHGLGEPLLAKDAMRMLELIKQRGIETVIVSNLQWDNIDVEKLMSLIRHMYISYHAIDEDMYYQITRNTGNWELLHSNIEKIKKYNSYGADVMLNYVCTNKNIHLVPQMIQRAYDLGVLSVRFQIVQNWATKEEEKYHNQLDSLGINDFDSIYSYFITAQRLAKKLGVKMEVVGNEKFDYQQCIWPFRRAYITFRGEVVPCCMRPSPEYSMGNILKDDFNKIWKSERYAALRNQLSNNCSSSLCRDCPYIVIAEQIGKIKEKLKEDMENEMYLGVSSLE